MLIALIAVFLLLRPSKDATPQPPLIIKRITSTGTVTGAAISPDGKYVAYVHSDQNKQSLILRRVETGQDLQLVAPAEGGYWGHAFAPDGASIYYTFKSRTSPKGTLHSIPILGGTPRRILDGIDSPVSFSPDGKRITYVRGEPELDESSLVVANADGSGVRTLAKRRPPQFFYPIWYTAPAWSPDGKRIAVSEATRGEPEDETSSLIAVDVASGAARTISRGWRATQQAAWLPDGKELILVGVRERRESQVWRVEASSGNAWPVTNDLLLYRMPTLTADGSTIVAVAMDRNADLWRVPLDGGEPPKKIRAGKGVGLLGVDAGPDGSIVYVSQDSGMHDLWITDANGTSARQLTNDPTAEAGPIMTPDRKTIVFGVYRGNGSVRRIAAGGSETRSTEIVTSAWDLPAVSPDGKTVVFRGPAGLNRVSIDGGKPTLITRLPAQRPAISADGTRIAFYCRLSGQPYAIYIVPMAGGAPEQTIEAPGPNEYSVLRWTPDGKALLVNTMPEDRRNVWRFPLDGSAPKALTSFTDQLIFSFDLTPDGKALILSRGELTRDAMMITGFR